MRLPPPFPRYLGGHLGAEGDAHQAAEAAEEAAAVGGGGEEACRAGQPLLENHLRGGQGQWGARAMRGGKGSE